MEHSRAILLRKTVWSETSLIVSWLTESHGHIRTVARGARKPRSAFAGRLDLFFQAEISYVLSKKSDLHELREVGSVSPFDPTRAGSTGFYLAAYFAELAGASAPTMHPAVEIFDLLTRGLNYLQNKTPTEAGLIHFEKELCRALGVHDARGLVGSQEGLASLGGGLPRSRAAALRLLR